MERCNNFISTCYLAINRSAFALTQARAYPTTKLGKHGIGCVRKPNDYYIPQQTSITLDFTKLILSSHAPINLPCLNQTSSSVGQESLVPFAPTGSQKLESKPQSSSAPQLSAKQANKLIFVVRHDRSSNLWASRRLSARKPRRRKVLHS